MDKFMNYRKILKAFGAWLRLSMRNKIFDIAAIILGGVVLLLNLLVSNSVILNILVVVSALLGLVYAIYPIYLYRKSRVEFDWHLMQGKFLYKVSALVLLMPSVITSLFLFLNATFIDLSSKDLVHEENLYEQGSKDTLVVNHEFLKDSVIAQIHGCEVVGDQVVIVESNLPASIKEHQTDPSLFWSVYYHFIDPGNQHMSTSLPGRICAALAAILGVFLLNGLLVSSIIGWIDRRKEKLQNGDLDYSLQHLGKYRFAVVIGANEIASSVIRNLLYERKEDALNNKNEGDNQYILLQTNKDISAVREVLASHLTDEQLQKVLLYKGQRDSDEDLAKLFPEYSTEIYILGEYSLLDGGESFHDAMNMRCANLLAHRLASTQKARKPDYPVHSLKRVCKVLFEYQTTQSVFHFSDVTAEVKNNLLFLPFNRYESWARTVIVENQAVEDIALTHSIASAKPNMIDYLPLDGEAGIKPHEDKHVHFIVVGMSKMGIAMGLQAMLQAHYVNYAQAETLNDKAERIQKKQMRRTRITFIDSNMDKEFNFFMGRYANMFKLTRYRYFDANQSNNIIDRLWKDPIEKNDHFVHICRDGKAENFIDLEIEFIKGELESEGVRRYLESIPDSKDKLNLTIAICLPKTHEALAASLYMPISVYDKAQQIWVYQREAADIVLNLMKTKQEDKRYKILRPFGMIYGEFMCDRSLYLKGILVNGSYALNELNIANIDMAKKETYSKLRTKWKELTLDKRLSNKYFADSIYQKLRGVLSENEYKSLVEAYSDESLCKLRGVLTNETTDAENLQKRLLLAICEHNRWNVEQLMFGYAPCSNADDKRLHQLDEYCQMGIDDLDELDGLTLPNRIEDAKIKLQHKELADIMENIYKEEKDDLKQGPHRVHPNICDYAHLDDIDHGAKGYDLQLNSVIPYILELVDRKVYVTTL